MATVRNVALRAGDCAVQKYPWHSTKSGVHHTCTNCNTGNNIEKENLRSGTGGKPLCSECHDLIVKGRC